MNKIQYYLDEIRKGLDIINSTTLLKNGIPLPEEVERKMNLVKILRSVETLISKLDNIKNEEIYGIAGIFEKYKSFVRKTKNVFTEAGISKVDLFQRSEEYFDARKRSKNIKSLYNNLKPIRCTLGLSLIRNKDTYQWKRNLPRKERRKILFQDIPEAKKHRQKLRTFSKEEVKKFYIILYLDNILSVFDRWNEFDRFVEYFSDYEKGQDYNNKFLDKLSKELKQKYDPLIEKLLYNLKYFYR